MLERKIRGRVKKSFYTFVSDAYVRLDAAALPFKKNELKLIYRFVMPTDKRVFASPCGELCGEQRLFQRFEEGNTQGIPRRRTHPRRFLS